MPTPRDEELYNHVKNYIISKYKKNSAYRSGAIIKYYKHVYSLLHGPNSEPYIDDDSPRNLARWYRERWTDVSPLIGKKSAYPLYRPLIRVSKNTPTTFEEIPKSNLIQQYNLKQIYKGNKNLPPFKKTDKAGRQKTLS